MIKIALPLGIFFQKKSIFFIFENRFIVYVMYLNKRPTIKNKFNFINVSQLS